MNAKGKICLTRNQGIKIIESFYGSGLKQKEFCARNNIAYHIVQYWKPIYHKHINNVHKPAKFVPVKLLSPRLAESEQVIPIKIVFNSIMTIEVQAGAEYASKQVHH